jgi:hypothetical protein
MPCLCLCLSLFVCVCAFVCVCVCVCACCRIVQKPAYHHACNLLSSSSFSGGETSKIVARRNSLSVPDPEMLKEKICELPNREARSPRPPSGGSRG